MRAGSVCAGPALPRCPGSVTAQYGPALGPLTAAATALMRPWKNRAIDHVVRVSNAVAEGNRSRARPGRPASYLISSVMRLSAVARAAWRRAGPA